MYFFIFPFLYLGHTAKLHFTENTNILLKIFFYNLKVDMIELALSIYKVLLYEIRLWRIRDRLALFMCDIFVGSIPTIRFFMRSYENNIIVEKEKKG